MRRESAFLIVLLIILLVSLSSATEVQGVEASGTIYIKADGSIDPPTAPISTFDNVTYTLTGNITNDADGIVVERSNIIVDGADYTLQGTGNGTGIDLSGTVNVTVKNTQVSIFHVGVFLNSSSNGNVSGNNMTNNIIGVWLLDSSNSSILENLFINNGMVETCSFGNVVGGNLVNGKPLVYLEGASDNVVNNAGQVIIVDSTGIEIQNLDLSNATVGVELWNSNDCTVSQNNVTNNIDGLALANCSSNRIFGNNITNNVEGFELGDSSNNTIFGNNIVTNENEGLFLLVNSSDNAICHNNLNGNSSQVFSRAGSMNTWNDGYPSGGNYWSNYNGTDANQDGISDTPYVIDENNTDNYPLMAPINFFDTGTWNDTTYYVNIVSNSTLSHFHFNPDEGTYASLWVKGETTNETIGFCRVAIPKNLLWVDDGWTVLYGSAPLTYKTFSDENCTYLYFTYTNPYQNVFTTVTIYGTHTIPEFPSFLILGLFMIATLLAVITYRRKHR